MCNLYSVTKGQAAIVALTRALRDSTGNLSFYARRVSRFHGPGGAQQRHQRTRNAAVGNAGPASVRRSTDHKHSQCEVATLARMAHAREPVCRPSTSFCEYADTKPKKIPTWFAFDQNRPLAVFAGIWTSWIGTRGPKSRPETGEHQLFGFLTTDANEEVGAVRPKAMPDRGDPAKHEFLHVRGFPSVDT